MHARWSFLYSVAGGQICAGGAITGRIIVGGATAGADVAFRDHLASSGGREFRRKLHRPPVRRSMRRSYGSRERAVVRRAHGLYAGIVGAAARPNWVDRPPRETAGLLGAVPLTCSSG
jgi:hypothetical protein